MVRMLTQWKQVLLHALPHDHEWAWRSDYMLGTVWPLLCHDYLV
jgi:hypothetical protein